MGIICLASISILEKHIPGLDMCTEKERRRKIYYLKQKSQPKAAPSSCKWYLTTLQYEVPLTFSKKGALISSRLGSNRAFHLHRAFFIQFLTLSLFSGKLDSTYECKASLYIIHSHSSF